MYCKGLMETVFVCGNYLKKRDSFYFDVAAVLEDLKLALEEQVPMFQVDSNSTNTIELLTRRNYSLWRIKNVIWNICLLDKFKDCNMSHVF